MHIAYRTYLSLRTFRHSSIIYENINFCFCLVYFLCKGSDRLEIQHIYHFELNKIASSSLDNVINCGFPFVKVIIR